MHLERIWKLIWYVYSCMKVIQKGLKITLICIWQNLNHPNYRQTLTWLQEIKYRANQKRENRWPKFYKDKNKPSRSTANGWFILWKTENKSLKKFEMDDLNFRKLWKVPLSSIEQMTWILLNEKWVGRGWHVYHFWACFSIKSRMAYSPIAMIHRITMDISTHVSLKVWEP